MNQLIMRNIKPEIITALKAEGYIFVPGLYYEKWTLGSNDNLWFSKKIVRSSINSKASEIVEDIAGVANGSVTDAQRNTYVSWFTDGYRGRGTAAI